MKSNENFVNLIKKIKKSGEFKKKIIMINHDDYKNHLHFLKFLDKTYQFRIALLKKIENSCKNS